MFWTRTKDNTMMVAAGPTDHELAMAGFPITTEVTCQGEDGIIRGVLTHPPFDEVGQGGVDAFNNHLWTIRSMWENVEGVQIETFFYHENLKYVLYNSDVGHFGDVTEQFDPFFHLVVLP